jgi:pimeloyl-ACP methyl ester carboxylesterase
MTEVERIEYDEFALFHENASEFGIPYDEPPAVRREFVPVDDERKLSALVWGGEETSPQIVFLHGGAQNAHTWDTVALALARPLVCIDLPSHGHSDLGRGGAIDPVASAEDVAAVVRSLASDARAVVGMSLGGLTTIALTRVAPELARKVVLVDVTPGVDEGKSTTITNFIMGPESFPSFDEILARTIEFNPTRTESSLRRGILHNAVQRDDGSWVWRYARFRARDNEAIGEQGFPKFNVLWDDVSNIAVPVMLVRGMLPQSVVDDKDEAELVRRLPDVRIEHVENAGHSVQGDTPLELANLIQDFVDD